jgi:hypothetical protein
MAGLNIAPCVRLTRKRDQKQRSQVCLSLTPSVGILHDLEGQKIKYLWLQRCVNGCVVFVGTNYRHVKAAEEKTACSASERYAPIKPQSCQTTEPKSLTWNKSEIWVWGPGTVGSSHPQLFILIITCVPRIKPQDKDRHASSLFVKWFQEALVGRKWFGVL